jgi:hypothetical protein
MERPEASADTLSSELRFLLVPAQTECRSEGHTDTDSQTDVIYRYPNADAESKANGNAKRNSLPCCF